MTKDFRSRRWCKMVLLVLACSTFGAVDAKAQEFSADIVMRHGDLSTPAGRLSVRDGKVRIETAEHPDGFFLVDTAQPSAYFVRPAASTYMDARQSSRLTQLFVPVDPDAPCRQWQNMAHLVGLIVSSEWRCELTAEGTIDGHRTLAFRVLSGTEEEFLGWIDRERRFPLRIRTEDGTRILLKQIRDEPQTATAFEVPARFRKFSPAMLIERIKQSDVWVSRPHDAEPSRP